MRDFDFLTPTRLDEVCGLLQTHGDNARLIAGGTALILALRQRLVMPEALISLSQVSGLRDIGVSDGQLRIGACCSHTQVATSAVVQQHAPALAMLAGKLANPQVRHQGTLGGNLAYADPTTDPPGCLLAMNAQAVLQSPQGARTLALGDFLTDYFETALRADEVLARIDVPVPSVQGRTTYLRHLRTLADHRPMANVSVHSDNTDGGSVFRVVVAAATPLPWSVPFATDWIGTAPTPARIADFASAVANDMDPLSDSRCDSGYRREVVRVLLGRALHRHFDLDTGSAT